MNWNFLSKAPKDFDESDITSYLTVAYYGLFVIAILLVIILGYWLAPTTVFAADSQVGKALQSLEMLVVMGGVFGGLYQTKRMKTNLISLPEEQRLQPYLKLATLRIVLIAMGYLLGVVLFYLLDHCQPMLWCCAICFVAQTMAKPSATRLEVELHPEKFTNNPDAQA